MNVFLSLLTRYISIYFSVLVCVVCGSGEGRVYGGRGGLCVCTGGIGVNKGAIYFLLQCWKVPSVSPIAHFDTGLVTRHGERIQVVPDCGGPWGSKPELCN